jgi:hypothetical protein
VFQGLVKKNWKKRWFIVTNQADGYAIHYYEAETEELDEKKAKGVFRLCGYRAHHITDEDYQKQYGELCIKIEPWWGSDRRRTWYVCLVEVASLVVLCFGWVWGVELWN